MQTIHQFKINNLKGETINFADFAGKRLLVVNVASECGLTPQYAQLVEMNQSFGDQIQIIGCPANNFGAQEPGSDKEIHTFCSTTYGVDFPVTTKISVKGDDMHPLYQFLTQKDQNGVLDTEVTWNFQKFVLDEEGRLVSFFAPTVEPADETILKALGVGLNH